MTGAGMFFVQLYIMRNSCKGPSMNQSSKVQFKIQVVLETEMWKVYRQMEDRRQVMARAHKSFSRP